MKEGSRNAAYAEVAAYEERAARRLRDYRGTTKALNRTGSPPPSSISTKPPSPSISGYALKKLLRVLNK